MSINKRFLRLTIVLIVIASGAGATVGAVLGGLGVWKSEYRLRAERVAFPDQAILVGLITGANALIVGVFVGLLALAVRATLKKQSQKQGERKD